LARQAQPLEEQIEVAKDFGKEAEAGQKQEIDVKFNIEIEKLLSDEEEPNQANLNPAQGQDGSTLSMRSLDFTSI